MSNNFEPLATTTDAATILSSCLARFSDAGIRPPHIEINPLHACEIVIDGIPAWTFEDAMRICDSILA